MIILYNNPLISYIKEKKIVVSFIYRIICILFSVKIKRKNEIKIEYINECPFVVNTLIFNNIINTIIRGKI